MRILLTKISDERHTLELVRADGARERVECETRSLLVHDLLHYAVESEAGLAFGFWGLLANGKTLADMNDRTGAALAEQAPRLMLVEKIVGALSSLARGASSRDLAEGLQRTMTAQGQESPPWLDERFLDRVRERMRRLMGHWKATPFRETMGLDWPPPISAF